MAFTAGQINILIKAQDQASRTMRGIGGAAGKMGKAVKVAAAPIKRLIYKGRTEGMLIDMTAGRCTRAALFMANGVTILSALTPETIQARMGQKGGVG